MNIIEVNNAINIEESKELIDQFFQDEPGIKYYTVDECNESPLMKRVLNIFDTALDKYAKVSGIDRKLFYNNIAAVMQDSNTDISDTNSLHFDDSVSITNGKLEISPCILLLYLTSSNVDYYGGQLIFPFQNKIIDPQLGKIAVFPTGYLHSHKVLPFFGGDRYLFRVIALFDTNLDSVDSKRLADRLNIKQEDKKL